MFLELIAGAHRACGNRGEALAMVDGALALGEETGQHWWDGRLLRVRGELLAELGQAPPSEAEDVLRKGARVARSMGDRMSELRCLASLARLLLAAGDTSAPENLIRPVYSELEEGLGTPAAAEAADLLGERVAGVT
jgi:hypothetical protein